MRAATCFVVALPVEGLPLRQAYELQPTGEALPFPLFSNGEVHLVISGVGKIAAAAACGFLYAHLGSPRAAVWINVGIAGRREGRLGDPVLAHRVVDLSSGASFYPPLLFDRPCDTAEVVTVDRVELDYPGEGLYEMEAAGFCAAAARLTSAELVQVLKLVSDTTAEPVQGIDRRAIRRFMEGGLETLETLRSRLLPLAAELQESDLVEADLAPFLERWHFTVTQRNQLRRCLERWRALGEGCGPWSAELEASSGARQVLRQLEQRLAARYGETPLGREVEG